MKTYYRYSGLHSSICVYSPKFSLPDMKSERIVLNNVKIDVSNSRTKRNAVGASRIVGLLVDGWIFGLKDGMLDGMEVGLREGIREGSKLG